MGRKYQHIELTNTEKSILEQGYKTAKSHVTRRKCQAILLNAEGKTVAEIELILDACAQSIYEWIRSWKKFGIKGLELKPGRGRKPKLHKDNEHHKEFIKKLVDNDPQNLKEVVTEIKSELNIDLSKKTLTRFLKNISNTDGNDFEED